MTWTTCNWICGIGITFVVSLWAGLLVGASIELKAMEINAVKENVAHWEVTPTGSPVFVWNKNPENKKD